MGRMGSARLSTPQPPQSPPQGHFVFSFPQGCLSAASVRLVWTQGLPCPSLLAQGTGMEPVSSPLTTHVLDTASGLPAQGLCLRLSRLEDHSQQWTELRKR